MRSAHASAQEVRSYGAADGVSNISISAGTPFRMYMENDDCLNQNASIIAADIVTGAGLLGLDSNSLFDIPFVEEGGTLYRMTNLKASQIWQRRLNVYWKFTGRQSQYMDANLGPLERPAVGKNVYPYRSRLFISSELPYIHVLAK